MRCSCRHLSALIMKVLFIQAILLSGAWLYADEQYSLQRLEVEDGLSQNMVYCICQDSHGFMWFGTQGGLNRYDGNTFKVFRYGSGRQLGNDGIMSMAEGPDGKLWVGTLQGLYIYDPRYEDFSPVFTDGIIRDISFSESGDAYVIYDDRTLLCFSPDMERKALKSFPDSYGGSFRRVCPDEEGNVWAACYNAGLFCRRSDGTEFFFTLSGSEEDMFTDVVLLDTENLLVGTMDRGVLRFNIRSRSFFPVEGLGPESVKFVHAILGDSCGRIWTGAENGLFIKDNKGVTHLTHISNNPFSLSDNAVFSLSEDCDGGIWVGTYFGGVNYYSQYLAQFKKYFPVPGSNELKGKNISEFLEASDGLIWVGTEDAGLHRLDPSDGKFENGFIPANNVHALSELDGKLWVGTYGKGLYILDTRTGISRNYLFSKRGLTQMEDNVYSIFRDMDGRTLIGTDGGLYEFIMSSGTLKGIAQGQIGGTVKDICQDFYGNIWVATAGQGLFRQDAESGEWENVYTEQNYFSCILEDQEHDLWFGTEGSGILHYDHAAESFDIACTTSDGMPDETVYMLLEDEQHNIWGSTNHGIFRRARKDGGIVVFDHKSGLTCDQYNFRSGIRTGDGLFYFGGVKGFVSFDPSRIIRPEGQSRIVFSRMLLKNREVDLRDKASPLKRSIVYGDRIVLSHDQSSFSIGFADLSYPLSGVRSYQYRMIGHDGNWYDVSRSRLITFSELPHGRYTLEIRANSYAEESAETNASIELQVLPPWYLTWWAYAVYAIALILFICLAFMLIMRVENKRNRDMLERMEMRKENELYNAKIDFFTHITHEIRTPLTLITAPMDEIMEKTGPDHPAYDDLSIVRKNSHRLLSLVNELLDFRKVEAGNVLPNFVHIDISSLTRDILERFRKEFETRNLELVASIPEKAEADVDVEIVTKILSNIILNACKYARTRISVGLEMSAEMFRIAISNDGERIPDDEAEHIFSPFVKLDRNIPGSGLGLPYARTLAATHGGSIYLDTSSDETCFVISMPLAQEASLSMETADDSPGPVRSSGESGTENREKILVVDDNEDFRAFLSRKIGQEYTVFTAADGKEARAILGVEMIDLVVADLMMPGMDGSNLCASIKEDINTSHIPVILVTARSDMETKIECIRKGADDFISKPFQTSYLMVRIENLLKTRKNLMNSLATSPDFTLDTIATSRKDEEFITRLRETIESRMEDPKLDVDVLAEAMNMSRATFYRKMKGFTDVSPNEFIRLCRLRKAAEMLARGDAPVNEIAYAVGFSSPSYFSRCFSRQFGVSPKDYSPHSQLS